MITCMSIPKPILFSDFHGVLSSDVFWKSLPRDTFNTVEQFVFQKNLPLVEDWMTGKTSSEEVNQIVANHIGMPFEDLWKIFVRDCESMEVSKESLDLIHRLRDQYVTILITVNMDSFTRFTAPALGLDQYFDRIVNSSDEGMGKVDNEGELFLKYTSLYNAPIEDSRMYDDSLEVCEVFQRLGGSAYLVTPHKRLEQYLGAHFTHDLET